jgi:hypothetical protein
MKGRLATTLLVLPMVVGSGACDRAPAASREPLGPAATALPDSQAAPRGAPPPPAFNRTLSLQGIRFVVESPNLQAGNHVRISAQGLANGSRTIDRELHGPVIGADVADLDADGSPEIYVHAGGSGRATLVAYATSRRAAMDDIYLPPLEDASGAAIGFVGPERFEIVGTSLLRRFPVAGGKTRQLRYRLHAGEAGWRLRLFLTDEF